MTKCKCKQQKLHLTSLVATKGNAHYIRLALLPPGFQMKTRPRMHWNKGWMFIVYKLLHNWVLDTWLAKPPIATLDANGRNTYIFFLSESTKERAHNIDHLRRSGKQNAVSSLIHPLSSSRWPVWHIFFSKYMKDGRKAPVCHHKLNGKRQRPCRCFFLRNSSEGSERMNSERFKR